VSYWLKYYRKSEKISQQTLADRIGIHYGNYIKQIENSELYPNREVSQKLAEYFKLNTKYFFDPYLEDTEDCPNRLYAYRKDNDLKIKEAAKIAGVSPGTWSNWEKGRYGVNRENYLKLKALRIL
jgi:transcriptional regulator with XRE-family HTH domain